METEEDWFAKTQFEKEGGEGGELGQTVRENKATHQKKRGQREGSPTQQKIVTIGGKRLRERLPRR